MFQLSKLPLEQLNLREGLNRPQAGACCLFEGLARDNNQGRMVIALEYEAQPLLCQKEAEKIFQEVKEKFDVLEVRVFHRIGKLKIGEMAVWAGVLASHRDAAFKACQYTIDELKQRLSIWKKEYYKDGQSGWIGCEQEFSTIS